MHLCRAKGLLSSLLTSLSNTAPSGNSVTSPSTSSGNTTTALGMDGLYAQQPSIFFSLRPTFLNSDNHFWSPTVHLWLNQSTMLPVYCSIDFLRSIFLYAVSTNLRL